MPKIFLTSFLVPSTFPDNVNARVACGRGYFRVADLYIV